MNVDTVAKEDIFIKVGVIGNQKDLLLVDYTKIFQHVNLMNSLHVIIIPLENMMIVQSTNTNNQIVEENVLLLLIKILIMMIKLQEAKLTVLQVKAE